MRISTFISSVENGLIRATKATGRQARRINHAMQIELAANRIAEGKAEAIKLDRRSAIEAYEIEARTDELLNKREFNELRNDLQAQRKELAKRVVQGATFDEIESRARMIKHLSLAGIGSVE